MDALQERIVEVLKHEVEERIIEVPQVQYVDRIVEVPQTVVHEKITHVSKPVIQERVKHVPKVVYQEKIVEVPQVKVSIFGSAHATGNQRNRRKSVSVFPRVGRKLSGRKFSASASDCFFLIFVASGR